MAYVESGKKFDKEKNYEKMKTRMQDMDICQYSLRIPAPLYKKVRIKLASENLRLRKVLLDMLEQYIKE